MQGNPVLVTGATGGIGDRLVPAPLEARYRGRPLARKIAARAEALAREASTAATTAREEMSR